MKLFVVSDVHSFMMPMMTELNNKGFEPNNPEQLLIICGDLFDRGPDTIKLIDYINNLTNVVLIRGNHEDLMEQMCRRGYAKAHDNSNGTLRTANDILCKYDVECIADEPLTLVKEVLESIFSRMVDYFETEKYIFVHGWIPMKYDINKKFAEYGDPTLFDENWRDGDWNAARWLNGMKMAKAGIIVPGKTIICGHWHCSYGHMLDSIKTGNWISEFEEDAIWDPYYSDGIIAIDRCTAYTGSVNVLVLEDEFLKNTP